MRKPTIPLVLTISLVLIVSGCRSSRRRVAAKPAGPTLMHIAEVAERLDLEVSDRSTPGMLILSGPGGTIVFRPPVIIVNDAACFRSHRTRIQGDKVLIPGDFFATAAKHLRSPADVPRDDRADSDDRTVPDRPSPSPPHVVIDPGHGGRDPGAVCPHGYEKSVALAVSRHIASRLRARGIEVTMTRTGDEFIPLNERPAIGNRLGADAFVSIHADAAADPGVHGFTVYVGAQDGGRYSDSARADAIASEVGVASVQLRPTLAANRRKSLRLASAIRQQMSRATSSPDRGTRHAKFRVLERSAPPAVLIELGFLTNDREARRLFQPAYQQTLAAAIADGIEQFLNSGQRSAE